MAKTLEFTTKSPRQIKQGDTETTFTFICKNDGSVVDLTKATNITAKIGNASGYLRSQSIAINSLATLNQGWLNLQPMPDLISGLPAGDYQLEIWVVDQAGTSIYPSDAPLGFTITNNIENESGASITTIAFDDFVKAMNKAASTIAKGERGKQIFKSGYDYAPNSSTNNWSDLSPAVSVDNPPKIGDTVITSSDNIFQIGTVVVGGGNGGGVFGVGDVLGNIKGDKGDTPDLSNYTTVTDLNNGLSTKVTDNKDGTVQINGHNIRPFDTVQNGYLPYGLDFNNYINSGNYRFDNTTTINYPPMSIFPSYWQLIVFGDGNSIYQIAVGNHITATRQFFAGSGWSSWVQVADDSKVLHLSTGDTAARPTGISAGYQYFDTSLNKPIWYTGKNWVDATGITV